MSGVGKTFKKVIKKPGRALTAVGTFGQSEVLRKAGGKKVSGLMDTVDKGYLVGGTLAAGAAALGPAGAGIWGAGPGAAGVAGATGAANGVAGGAAALSASGGVPLLTKVLLGTSVASALAGYFGKKSPEDYSQWFDSLNAEDQQYVKELENNLTGLQQNLEVRNQAVQKVVDDFPNIVKQGIEQFSGVYDEATKKVLDQASNQLAAKFSASGGFSSGAFNEGLAKAANETAVQRVDKAASLSLEGYNKRLAEVEALRNFQQTMLGVGTQNRFSAAQASLARRSSQLGTLAGIDASNNQAENASTQQLFGGIGQTLGTAAMLPMYQQLYNPNQVSTVPNTNTSGNVPVTQGGTGAPRLNLKPDYGYRNIG